MKTLSGVLLLAVLFAVPLGAQQGQVYETTESQIQFEAMDVYVDPAGAPLAAYQFELKTVSGQIEIVGVEGGQHNAFSEPGYYDPEALKNDRIIIAAYSTDENLPTEKTRVATIHLQVTGDIEPQYELELVVAAGFDGENIKAEISFE